MRRALLFLVACCATAQLNGMALVNEGFALFNAGKIADAWNVWDDAVKTANDNKALGMAHRNLAVLRAVAYDAKLGTGVDPLLTRNLTAASQHARESARLTPSADATERVRSLSLQLHGDALREVHANAWQRFVGDVVSFVEIGTADYETLTQHVASRRLRNWRGVAVEPVPWLAERIGAENAMICAENGVGHIRAVRPDDPRLANGDFVPRGMSYASHVDAPPGQTFFETLSVPCLRYDALLAKHGLSAVDLLKVDAEGADAAIVHAALDHHFLTHPYSPLRRVVFESTLDREPYLQPYDAHTTAFARNRDDLLRRLLALGFSCTCSHDNCDCVHRSVFFSS